MDRMADKHTKRVPNISQCTAVHISHMAGPYCKNTGLTASSTGQKNGKAITERQTIWEDGVLE